MGLFEQFPYSNFHNLNLDWVLKMLKEYGVVIDGLDEKIKEMIDQGLEDLNIVELILDAMTEYGLVINVMAPPNNLPPCSGDGSTNDTETIQGCIDYAHANNGKFVYFPSGTYSTESLVLKDGVSIGGFSRATTKIVLRGGALKALISGTTSNNIISNITLDSNMSIQVNDVNVIDLTGGKYNFNNLIITDGYDIMKLTLNDYVQGSNIIFSKGVTNGLVINGTGTVNFDNIIFERLSDLEGKYCIDNSVDNSVYNGIYSTCRVETAIRNTSSKSVFIGKILNAVNELSDSGTDTYYNFYDRGSNTSKGLEEEIQDRIEADTTLQDNIDTETLARESADNALQDSIDYETLARETSDSALQDSIDAETLARESADTTLQDIVDAEKLARESADNTLQDSIDAETLARETSDSALQDIIDAETLARETADNALQDSIENTRVYASVMDYGAIGDGVTDDTQAFLDALANNKTVYVPFTTGGYSVGAITLLDGQSLIGDPQKTILKLRTGIDWCTIHGTNIKVANFRILCGNTTGNVFLIDSLNLTCTYIYIENIFTYQATRVLWDNGGNNNQITSLYVRGVTSSLQRGDAYGITKGEAFIFFSNVVVDYATTGGSNNSTAFFLKNNNGAIFTDCDVLGSASNGSNTNQNGYVFENCNAVWLIRCMSDTMDNCGFIVRGASSYFYFIGCTSSLNSNHQFLLENGVDIKFDNCYAGGRNHLPYALPDSDGIHIKNAVQRVIIGTTRIVGCTGSGLVCDGVSFINASGMIIDSNGKYGIETNGTTTGLYSNITCVGNLTGNYSLSSALEYIRNLYKGDGTVVDVDGPNVG